MTYREVQIESLWTYEISTKKVLQLAVKKGFITKANEFFEKLFEQLDTRKNPGYLIQSWIRSNTTIECLRMWEKIYNPRFQEVAYDDLNHTIKTTSTTLTPSMWINTTQAMGMRTCRGKGGRTTAHLEIVTMFRAWLFPEVMLGIWCNAIGWFNMIQDWGAGYENLQG